MIRLILEHQAKDEENAARLLETIHEIRDEALKQPGYITGETLVNTEDPCNIIVISSWQSIEHWRAWHESGRQALVAQRLNSLLVEPRTARTYRHSLVREKRVWSTF